MLVYSNGTIVSEGNININGARSENAEKEMLYILNKIDAAYFSNDNIEIHDEDYSLEEMNININTPLEVAGNAELTGNININTAIKALENIVLNGEVKNTNDSVIYSKYGDIIIDSSNVNLNGLVYAPLGNVTITAQNLNLNNVVIIADTITFNCPSVNANYSTNAANFVGNISEVIDIPYDEWHYMKDENENDFPDFFENSINWKHLLDTDSDGVPDVVEIYTNTDENNINTEYKDLLDGYVPNLTLNNPLILSNKNNKELFAYGDINNDLIIDAFDLILLRKAFVDGEYFEKGDLNDDGKVNDVDLRLLSCYCLGVIRSFPVYDKFDSDNDGLSDYVEVEYYHTNPHLSDTDQDELPDYYEIFVLGTDPTSKGNDTDDDFDEDRLTNLEEYLHDTNPFLEDTDEDGISDYDEVYIYGTDPLSPDTDNDNLSDSDEIALGLNPLNPKSDGTDDGKRIFKQIINADSPILSEINTESNAYNLSLEINASGYVENCLSVNQSGYSYILKNGSAVGYTPEFTYDENFEVKSITLKFEIKEEYRENLDFISDYESSPELDGIKRFCVFKYFEDINMILPLETEFDIDNNTVYIVIDQFEEDENHHSYGIGSYSLVDLEIWAQMLTESYKVQQETNQLEESDINVLSDSWTLNSDTTTIDDPTNKSRLYKVVNIGSLIGNYVRPFYTYVNDSNGNRQKILCWQMCGKKYAIINEAGISWNDAKIACAKMGGHLLTINNSAEYSLLSNFITQNKKGRKYWLGAECENNVWKWITGESTSYIKSIHASYKGTSYNIDNFDEWFGNKIFYSVGLDYDLTQGYNRVDGYICEWELGRAIINDSPYGNNFLLAGGNSLLRLNGPLSATSGTDTDGDGIPDYDEIDFKAIKKIGGKKATSVTLSQCCQYAKELSFKLNLGENSPIAKALSDVSQGTLYKNEALNQVVYPIGSDPTNPDTDGDYYLDAVDKNKCKFDPMIIPDDCLDDSQSIDGINPVFNVNKSITDGVLNHVKIDGGMIKNSISFIRNSDFTGRYGFDYGDGIKFSLEPNRSSDYAITISDVDSSAINNPDSFISVINSTARPKYSVNYLSYEYNSDDNSITYHYSLSKMRSTNKYEIKITNNCSDLFSVTVEQDNWVHAQNGGIRTGVIGKYSKLKKIETYLPAEIVYSIIMGQREKAGNFPYEFSQVNYDAISKYVNSTSVQEMAPYILDGLEIGYKNKNTILKLLEESESIKDTSGIFIMLIEGAYDFVDKAPTGFIPFVSQISDTIDFVGYFASIYSKSKNADIGELEKALNNGKLNICISSDLSCEFPPEFFSWSEPTNERWDKQRYINKYYPSYVAEDYRTYYYRCDEIIPFDEDNQYVKKKGEFWIIDDKK